MPETQPTFEERIELLEMCANTVNGYAMTLISEATHGDYEQLSEAADLIADEVGRMKDAHKRFKDPATECAES